MAENTIRWFRIYSGAMAFLCLLYVVGGFFMFAYASELADAENPETFWQFMGVLVSVLGGMFMVAHSVPFFVKRQKWVWIYDLVMICLGFTSCCTLPFCIVLMLNWIKPEVQAAFGAGGPMAPNPPWRPE